LGGIGTEKDHVSHLSSGKKGEPSPKADKRKKNWRSRRLHLTLGGELRTFTKWEEEHRKSFGSLKWKKIKKRSESISYQNSRDVREVEAIRSPKTTLKGGGAIRGSTKH